MPPKTRYTDDFLLDVYKGVKGGKAFLKTQTIKEFMNEYGLTKRQMRSKIQQGFKHVAVGKVGAIYVYEHGKIVSNAITAPTTVCENVLVNLKKYGNTCFNKEHKDDVLNYLDTLNINYECKKYIFNYSKKELPKGGLEWNYYIELKN